MTWCSKPHDATTTTTTQCASTRSVSGRHGAASFAEADVRLQTKNDAPKAITPPNRRRPGAARDTPVATEDHEFVLPKAALGSMALDIVGGDDHDRRRLDAYEQSTRR